MNSKHSRGSHRGGSEKKEPAAPEVGKAPEDSEAPNEEEGHGHQEEPGEIQHQP